MPCLRLLKATITSWIQACADPSQTTLTNFDELTDVPGQDPTQAVLGKNGLPISVICRWRGRERFGMEGADFVILEVSTPPVVDAHGPLSFSLLGALEGFS